MEDTTRNCAILNRMLEALQTTNDSELARFLGVSPQAISKSRTSGKIPAPWPLKFADLSNVSMDWLCFGVGNMNRDGLATQVLPIAELSAQGDAGACERCRTLEKRLETVDAERRELSTENRQLLKENGTLKLENLTLTHHLEAARQMRHEAERARKNAEGTATPFDEQQIIQSSEPPRPRR